jgi:hypothetical protein
MTPSPPIIERPWRRPRWLVWRDRCVTAALWLAWLYPVEALARLAVPDVAAQLAGVPPGAALLGDAFLADVAAAGRTALFLVGSLLAWGSYGRWRRSASAPDTGLLVEESDRAAPTAFPGLPRSTATSGLPGHIPGGGRRGGR